MGKKLKRGKKANPVRKSKPNKRAPNSNERSPAPRRGNPISKSGKPTLASSAQRSWQKDTEKPLTKQEQRHNEEKNRKDSDNLMKLIVQEQLSSATPDSRKVLDSLSKIKSRGLKQRLKKKARAMGIFEE